ncbi:MAG: hypothetical protein Q8P67_09460, partial [archaeon]|nr:hypothetical protein [archaeon]
MNPPKYDTLMPRLRLPSAVLSCPIKAVWRGSIIPPKSTSGHTRYVAHPLAAAAPGTSPPVELPVVVELLVATPIKVLETPSPIKLLSSNSLPGPSSLSVVRCPSSSAVWC